MSEKLFLHQNRRAEADCLVTEYHYSRRPPANVQQVLTWHMDGGLFGGDGPAIAACYFSIPATRWSEQVWELSRLVRSDECSIPLTGLISEAIRKAKERIDLIVSFADSTQGHHGGIYQAASWQYAGLRKESVDGVVIGGNFIPGRSANSIFGTRSPKLLEEKLGVPVLAHYDKGKYCYWKALSKSGKRKANKLNLGELPYPKPKLD